MFLITRLELNDTKNKSIEDKANDKRPFYIDNEIQN